MTRAFVHGRRRALVEATAKAAGCAGLALGASGVAWGDVVPGDWAMGGQNLQNSRYQAQQQKISVSTAGSLALRWSQPTHGDVSATPAVANGAVYYPDWGGYLTKRDARTGNLLWERRLDTYAGEPQGATSRTSPAVVNGVVYIGDQNGAHLLAIDARSGNLLWSTQINSGAFAIITQSPIVHAGTVFVGAASTEEANAAFIPDYPCCTFRGSFSAIDAATGKIKWTNYTVPDNGGVSGGYSGGGVWSSTPAIDPGSGTVYTTTGNNYSVPAAVTACQTGGGTAGQCLSPDDHIDSVMAFDMATGRIKWSTGVQGFDAWNVACFLGSQPQNCPPSPGPDFDFGSGANLLTIKDGSGVPQLVVGAGQKSGIYWLFDARTGAIRSSTVIGPGSSLGGIEWGTATDGKRIYIANSNLYQIPYMVNGQLTTSGSFAAIDPATGKLLWQRADPSGSLLDLGPVGVANGVVLAGSMSGHMYALNAATGDVLWDYTGEGSSNAGAAIDSNGNLYWGNGYAHLGASLGTPSLTFYSFSVNGK